MSLVSSTISIPWLLRIRWAALSVYLLLLLLAAGAGLGLPFGAVSSLLAAGAAVNLWLAHQNRSGMALPEGTAGLLLLLDTALLTALLGLSGGPSNPFSTFYLVHVALAAMALGSGWAWIIAAASGAGFGLLFLWNHPVPAFLHHGEGGLSVHLAGMWIALTASALLVAHFSGRLAAALKTREADLSELRERTDRYQRLAALTTLAAGAAHDLATPLATVALAASELEREMGRSGASPAWQDDARLILQEARRCRSILDELSLRAGDLPGEAAEPLALDAWAQAFRSGLSAALARRLEVEASGTAFLPPRTLARILRGLVQNAVEASPDGAPVSLSISSGSGLARLVLRDAGAGMPTELARRAGEPFLTTKPGGMGLGLFLARLFAEQWGGRFTLESAQGAGTTIILELPAGEPRD